MEIATLVSLIITVASANVIPESFSAGKAAQPYSFSYSVRDEPTNNYYSHSETSDGQEVVGSYRVLLPDSRTQIVDYTSNHATGYVANVKYEGEAKYLENTPDIYTYPSRAVANAVPVESLPAVEVPVYQPTVAPVKQASDEIPAYEVSANDVSLDQTSESGNSLSETQQDPVDEVPVYQNPEKENFGSDSGSDVPVYQPTSDSQNLENEQTADQSSSDSENHVNDVQVYQADENSVNNENPYEEAYTTAVYEVPVYVPTLAPETPIYVPTSAPETPIYVPVSADEDSVYVPTEDYQQLISEEQASATEAEEPAIVTVGYEAPVYVPTEASLPDSPASEIPVEDYSVYPTAAYEAPYYQAPYYEATVYQVPSYDSPSYPHSQ